MKKKNEPNIYYSLCTHKEYISFYLYIFLYSNVLCHQSEFNVSLFIYFFCFNVNYENSDSLASSVNCHYLGSFFFFFYPYPFPKMQLKASFILFAYSFWMFLRRIWLHFIILFLLKWMSIPVISHFLTDTFVFLC